jgi:hypothetical protein
MADERGQATVELVGALPALLLAGLIALQLLLDGYALTLADGAAEAGALAAVRGGSPADAVREALPGWARDEVDVHAEGGTVIVRLSPPAAVPQLADLLMVESRAVARERR